MSQIPCRHIEYERYRLMTEAVNVTHDYSLLPDRYFIHKCSICGVECDEATLWEYMKEKYD